ncbi:MAG: hypothetical protein HN742_21595 [Lentisphaerae bacterium]|jgi:hypothetical protein|nr:hypothetical protein [Lentisphaerota bacterium]MBT5608329.1 hypothetical protein [Lentisphaerota bacterium]MBT7057476.1 hypothetical protein [Lentisphaerota bacterium]MBT7844486.1 hypothetical protein [Lentisphaerota bacterium]
MRITDVVNDPLTVTALTISSGDTAADTVVFISCDISVIPVYLIEEAQENIRDRSPSFPLDSLIFNATHTHAAPNIRDAIHDYDALPPTERENLMVPAEYRAFLAAHIADAALESWEGRTAGRLAWGFGHAVVGHNRRTSYLEDFAEQEFPGQKIERNARMYGKTDDPSFSHVEGHEDHSVQFLYTFDPDGRLTGAIINVPCPSQVTESWSRMSADYWHDTREAIRKVHGEDVFLLPQCSAAGDQSPHLQLHKAAEARMLALKEEGRGEEFDFNLAQRREIGRRIEAAFSEVLPWARKDMRDDAAVRHVTKTADLTRRMVSKEEHARNVSWMAMLKAKDDSHSETLLNRCQAVVDKYEEQDEAPTFAMENHVVRLGDIAFVTNPFELFLDYGVRVRARGPAIQTFVMQLVGSRTGTKDDHPGRFPRRGGTYLPTARAEAGGGYSACVYCNQVGHQGGQEWVDATLRELQQLFR